MSSSLNINTNSTVDPSGFYNVINNVAINPQIVVIVLFIILGYFAIFYLSSSSPSTSTPSPSFLSKITSMMPSAKTQSFMPLSNTASNSSTSSTYVNYVFLAIIILIVIGFFYLNAQKYLLQSTASANLSQILTPNPQLAINVDNSAPVNNSNSNLINQNAPQVFNIPENEFTYNDAQAVCKAYGARLATYEEVENAYNNGAEWCNYGWSDQQMALFPTQAATFNQLQSIPGHEHDCGRPGINGGYIANPRVKYGVNCYGKKPKITEDEYELMKTQPPYPVSAKDIAFQKRVDYWKNNLTKLLVSPFNHSLWAEII